MVVEVKTMELKKDQPVTKTTSISAKEASLKAGQWKNFLGDIKDEFKKISWTSPEELSTYTKIVVATTFFLGMGIYVMDLMIQLVLGGLEFMMRLIG